MTDADENRSDGPSGAGGLDYRSAGVDLEAAERSTARLRDIVAKTRDANTLSEVGFFGGLYAVPNDVPDPILVSSTDSVGTKVKVAFLTGRHHTLGRDLVNHCVNDILVQGAHPLFFLDYLGIGDLEEGVVDEIVRGVAEGCLENRCALLGGETAEMPEMYAPGEYDLAGFIVGAVARDRLLDGSRVEEGDVLVALASDGLHTNGYTLARKIVFERMGLAPDDPYPGEEAATVADVLLRVHRSYLSSLRPFLAEGVVRGLAHITGGGIAGNLRRILAPGLGAVVRKESWAVPSLFRVLQEGGGVEENEMFRVFNMGVGMVAVVSETEADRLTEGLEARGEKAWIAGQVTAGDGVEVT